jgi:hypothetical protein
MRYFAAIFIATLAAQAGVSFQHEVLPVLTRQGCNAGTCHGSPSGKDGFALSLAAFDALADYTTLTKGFLGRRIDVLDPHLSLLLRKPSNELSHRGGLKLPKGSREYRILYDWIAAGCPMDPPDTAACVAIDIQTEGRFVLHWPKPTTKLRITARFSDGEIRDVTHLAQFTSSDEAIATAQPDGTVTGIRRGQAAVMVRYLEHVEAKTFAFVKPIKGFQWSNPIPANYIDRHVHAKLREMQYLPSGLCTDNDFVRRVHLDVLGRLPTIAEIRAFLVDVRKDKRTRLIESLLVRPEYATFWAQKWGDLLRLEPKQITATGTHKFHQWLVQAFSNNLPYDRFAHALLTANGSTFTHPATNYYRTAKDTNDALETTSQIFLGSRLVCAKCHNHPYERWTQDNYYGLAAVFNRVQRQAGPRPDELFISNSRTGEVKQPRTGKTMKPWLPGKGYVAVADTTDRRRVFANWLIQKDNPWFARVEVNRIWAAVMGQGIVEPVDDFRDSNPPANAPLLNALAENFAKHGFDRKHLLRAILNSHTYQASARPNDFNRDDELFFSHYQPHLLSAEQMLDAVCQVTGTPEVFKGLPAGTRATALPSPQLNNGFLKVFGQPARSSACACERPTEPQLAQALELLNGKFLHGKLEHPTNRMHRLIAAKKTDPEIIRTIFLAALARDPTPVELKLTQGHVNNAKDRTQGLTDIFWSVLNMNEFLFQH